MRLRRVLFLNVGAWMFVASPEGVKGSHCSRGLLLPLPHARTRTHVHARTHTCTHKNYFSRLRLMFPSSFFIAEWMTASCGWMMPTCPRCPTVRLWRHWRWPAPSSGSTFAGGDPCWKLSLRSNSSKDQKVVTLPLIYLIFWGLNSQVKFERLLHYIILDNFPLPFRLNFHLSVSIFISLCLNPPPIIIITFSIYPSVCIYNSLPFSSSFSFFSLLLSKYQWCLRVNRITMHIQCPLFYLVFYQWGFVPTPQPPHKEITLMHYLYQRDESSLGKSCNESMGVFIRAHCGKTFSKWKLFPTINVES